MDCGRYITHDHRRKVSCVDFRKVSSYLPPMANVVRFMSYFVLGVGFIDRDWLCRMGPTEQAFTLFLNK
jgi:hypothetical protein